MLGAAMDKIAHDITSTNEPRMFARGSTQSVTAHDAPTWRSLDPTHTKW
jgi:hypothetical protein